MWSVALQTVAALWFIRWGPASGPPGVQARKVHVPGDIILGGLFPIHRKGVTTRCGPINSDRGIQRLEAMLFAIDKINKDDNLLKGIKLGATILDTCSSDSYALNQSLEFIRASINTVDASAFQCLDGSTPSMRFSSRAITAVVGGSYSEVSLQVANLLRLFRIPQVSPASTGTTLSDKTRYDFFARTVPSDTFQALALVDLVERFNWSYVSLVSSEGQYGDSGMTAFIKQARLRNICIGANEKIPHSADTSVFRQIYKNLDKKKNARGVVLFARAEDAKEILRAVHAEAKGEGHFVFLASDGWGKQDNIVQGVEETALGAITVELGSSYITEFDDYMRTRSPVDNLRNPWFEEYWEDLFSCIIPRRGSQDENGTFATGYVEPLKRCSPHLKLDESVAFKQESKVQFVVDAVYAIAHALHNAWKDLCSPRGQLYCSALRELDGGEFYKKYLLNVNFLDLAKNVVKFDAQGDGLGRYNIYNFQKVANATNTTKAQYKYTEVGKWHDGLHLNLEKISWPTGWGEHSSGSLPTSVCSSPCETGQIKITQPGDPCCWICQQCQPWEYILDEKTCQDCGEGWWPKDDKKSCFELDVQYMSWWSVFAAAPIALACFGICLTLSVVAVLVKHNDTPIVKATGRELSYMLLGGILTCYGMTFFMLAKPSRTICGLQRFGVGFGFSIIYSALLTKTNRISRIFDSARVSARRPSFISPKSQVVITLIFISVQVIATTVWFVIEPPGTRQYSPRDKRNEVILKCSIKDSSFLVSLVYNMFLIITCTVYAVKTRKIPENFNESKFIGFTMYTTCIIWLAFVPIYFGTGNSFEIQITTLCVSISLSAYVALFCLFSPKIYIILFHPDKNVRKLTMNSAAYKKAPTSSTCGTSANHGSSVEQVKLTVQATPSKGQHESDRDSLASL